LKCPCCGRSAVEDFYYNTDEKYTYCLRCVYNYSRTIESETEKNIEYREEKYDGYGVFVLKNSDGSSKKMLLNSLITDDKYEEFKALFLDSNVNQEKSYLVSFKDGEFLVLLGNPPANFHLSFNEYREKMFTKYGVPEFDFMVPIEE
ncbi:MAG: hypothetical protein K0Q87_4978, partial [Neobacillus sp.]|nr:hypothetical protein [Neobacillus sp.]